MSPNSFGPGPAERPSVLTEPCNAVQKMNAQDAEECVRLWSMLDDLSSLYQA